MFSHLVRSGRFVYAYVNTTLSRREKESYRRGDEEVVRNW